MHGFDKSGRPLINKEAVYDKDPITIYPTAGGGHNWAPMAFNPSTGLVDIPTTYGNWTFAAGDKVVPHPYGDTGLAEAFLTARPTRCLLSGLHLWTKSAVSCKPGTP